ncbi:MAG: hypothetical protein M1544_00420 [Candidatus Marsarchaeota archaeon]|nr:hypothetical protein [Candidatus Marsarchaeota archaeon]MCL5101809.1 hypothetical protein [Candidatus Marsarchaeota archaeon]
MPIKYNITKYDVLVGRIHKLIQKSNPQHAYANGLKQESSYDPDSPEEKRLMAMAVIVASFSSNHSWQTHKCLQKGGQMNIPEVKEEYLQAERNRWRNVSLTDMEEIASMQIQDSTFYNWLFYNVLKEKQKVYREAWTTLKGEFETACDEIERSKN